MVLFPQKLVRKINRARVDFAEPELRRFILQHGLDLKWESRSICPCVRQFDGQTSPFKGETFEPRVNCTECSGTGNLYFNSQRVKALFLSANQDEGLRQLYGERASGMVRVTVNHEHKPSIGDRYTAIPKEGDTPGEVSTFATDETRTRTAATVESLRYPIVVRQYEVGDGADPTLPEVRTLGIVYCRRADVNGELVGNVLVEGTDFVVTAAGDIDWTLGDGLTTAPVEDARYAVKYFSAPVYVVENIPHQHRDQQIKVRDPENEKSPDLKFTQLPIHAHCWFEQLGSTGLPLVGP